MDAVSSGGWVRATDFRASGGRSYRLSYTGMDYPREESNLTFDLRTVACLRHTPRMIVRPRFRGLVSSQRLRVQSPPSCR